MKKIIYILLLAFVVSVSFTACTEEEIKPKSELEGLGGNGSDPIRR
ncbi:MAG: hypothetical protein MUC73_01925 [Cyclobacteriaceae bacterium]|jgi:hypothetical protein|nr:hypothetical protein [Cyclobacteriaceae bacterium]